MQRADVDVLIAGGGFAGLTLAIALRQGLGDSFDDALAEEHRRHFLAMEVDDGEFIT